MLNCFCPNVCVVGCLKWTILCRSNLLPQEHKCILQGGRETFIHLVTAQERGTQRRGGQGMVVPHHHSQVACYFKEPNATSFIRVMLALMTKFLYPGTGFSLGSLPNLNQNPMDPSVVRDARLAAMERSNINNNNNKKKSFQPSWGDNEIGILEDMGFNSARARLALENCKASSLFARH